jgi:hypothetical protein
LVQARVDYSNNSKEDSYLIGLGADYWTNGKAVWDQYKTNKDIAIGRLKVIDENWKWYGLSTASDNDLTKLFEEGYESLNSKEMSH